MWLWEKITQTINEKKNPLMGIFFKLYTIFIPYENNHHRKSNAENIESVI
jgi:hypothetical protein